MRVKTLTIPSYITFVRFVLIPVFVNLFLNGYYKLALITFVIAGITDFLDGYIARTFNMRSRLGSMLDPAADKFLMLFSFSMLATKNYLPDYVAYTVVGRDFLIFIGVVLLWKAQIKVYYKPTLLSKGVTIIQILLLCHTFLFVYATHNDIDSLEHIRFLFTPGFKRNFCLFIVITTVASLIQYIYIFYKFWRYGEKRVNKVKAS